MKDSRTSLVPALTRGIRLLRLLADGRERSLHDLAAATGFPKPSVYRMLVTLERETLIHRTASGGGWQTQARLVLREAPRTREERIENGLARLADATGFTAEWYEPEPAGCVLHHRADPPRGEVTVRAREGFVRTWDGELDAVARVGHALAAPAPAPRSFWSYTAQARQRPLAAADARHRIALARTQAVAEDTTFNPNGVRRLATPCCPAGSLTGILALAVTYTPGHAARGSPLATALRQAAETLGHELEETHPCAS